MITGWVEDMLPALALLGQSKKFVSAPSELGVKVPTTFFQHCCSICILEAAPSPLGHEVSLLELGDSFLLK